MNRGLVVDGRLKAGKEVGQKRPTKRQTDFRRRSVRKVDSPRRVQHAAWQDKIFCDCHYPANGDWRWFEVILR